MVLMDEPFSALDAITRARLQALAAELLAGRTVLLVTHDPLEALRLGHRIQVMAGQPARIEEPICPAGAPPATCTTPPCWPARAICWRASPMPETRSLSNPRPLLVLAGLLLLWQGVVWLTGVPRFLLPPPPAGRPALLAPAPLLADQP